MKKLTRWMPVIMIVILGITACEGPMGPMGPEGPAGKPGKDGVADWYVPDDIEIKSNMWRLIYDDNKNPYYECRVSRSSYFKEISQSEFEFIFDKGLIICYLVQWVSYDGAKPILVQNPLPYIVYGDDGGFLYSESYSFEVLRTGHIIFTVKYSDFAEIRPDDRIFHVVMLW